MLPTSSAPGSRPAVGPSGHQQTSRKRGMGQNGTEWDGNPEFSFPFTQTTGNLALIPPGTNTEMGQNGKKWDTHGKFHSRFPQERNNPTPPPSRQRRKSDRIGHYLGGVQPLQEDQGALIRTDSQRIATPAPLPRPRPPRRGTPASGCPTRGCRPASPRTPPAPCPARTPGRRCPARPGCCAPQP